MIVNRVRGDIFAAPQKHTACRSGMPRQDRCARGRGNRGRSDGLGSGRHNAGRRRRSHPQGDGTVQEEARRLHALVNRNINQKKEKRNDTRKDRSQGT